MANMYRSVLESGGGVTPTGDALVGDVLSGKTFSNANNVGLEGTMPNNGAVTATVSGGQSYTIPAGYHNGSGTVTGLSTPISDTVYTLTETAQSVAVDAGDYILYLSSSGSGWAYTTVDGTRNDSDDVVPNGYSLVTGYVGTGKLFKATSQVTHTFNKGATSAIGSIIVLST